MILIGRVGFFQSSSSSSYSSCSSYSSWLPSSSEISLVQLNAHLETHSYLVGFEPSQHDTHLCQKLTKQSIEIPSELNHLLRWRNHIQSFNADSFSNNDNNDDFGRRVSFKSAPEKKGFLSRFFPPLLYLSLIHI